MPKKELLDALHAQHTVTETEHGPCCSQCSQEAADSDYRVTFPCPALQQAYAVLGLTPPGSVVDRVAEATQKVKGASHGH